jgi:hypothetical protein
MLVLLRFVIQSWRPQLGHVKQPPPGDMVSPQSGHLLMRHCILGEKKSFLDQPVFLGCSDELGIHPFWTKRHWEKGREDERGILPNTWGPANYP